MAKFHRSSAVVCALVALSGSFLISSRNLPSLSHQWLREVSDNNLDPYGTKIPGSTPVQQQQPQQPKISMVTYQAKDYTNLLGMQGFSDKALQQHFKLYQGYVSNTNQLMQTLAELSAKGDQKSQTWQDLRRRLSWEFDGMRLHEYYFDNLGGKQPIDSKSRLAQAIVEDWGSLSAWEQDFKATGAMRGIGWAILYQDPVTGQLFNIWVDEHADGHLAHGTPLLVMDVWEHAYMTDYGINRDQYIDAFVKNINWQVVQNRYNQANPQS